MKCRSSAPSKILFGCSNSIFFTCGFLEVVCGFLLLCDSKRILLSRLLASPESSLDHPPFYYLALILMASGLTMCATAALGCWATYLPGYATLSIYFLVVLSLLLCDCAGGVMAAIWPRCLGLENTHGGSVGALQSYYAVPDYEQFTASVDLAQTELHCCGMTDARNYDMSTWQLRRLGPSGMAVPFSCCIQDEQNNSYLNPVPLNASRCQEYKPNPVYRHVPGCIGKLDEWYQKQYFILMVGIFIFAVFKLGILLSTVISCIRLRKSRQILHTVTVKSLDHKTNDNLYSPRAEDHITAKYIQPNNYYSPRVRNPRIFTNKPNEMI